MSQPDSSWILDLATRFPGMDRDALGASAGDVRRLTDLLAVSHDLTMTEASEIIDEWQAGLAIPTPRRSAA